MSKLISALVALILTLALSACSARISEQNLEYARLKCEQNGGVEFFYVSNHYLSSNNPRAVSCKNGARFEMRYPRGGE